MENGKGDPITEEGRLKEQNKLQTNITTPSNIKNTRSSSEKTS